MIFTNRMDMGLMDTTTALKIFFTNVVPSYTYTLFFKLLNNFFLLFNVSLVFFCFYVVSYIILLNIILI